MKVLLTGACGFIGWKTGEFLLEGGHEVLGIDNINDYYDTKLKEYRLFKLKAYNMFRFIKGDIEDVAFLKKVFDEFRPDIVINLAARAGVRASIENPYVYYTTNVLGNLNLLELSVKYKVKRFILASTSSLYAGQKMPFTEDLPVNSPISPYAASKKSAEVTAYTYHYLYNLNVVVLRFFTVYGPASRPDMSLLRFLKWIYEARPVIIYGNGEQSRDFTYVDDIARGIILAMENIEGFEIINLGRGKEPISIKEIIKKYEHLLNKKAKIVFKEKNKADMESTQADITKAKKLLGWTPLISIDEGLKRTVEWYLKEGRHIGFKL